MPRFHIFDWAHDKVFAGYDPVDDGFAYPMEVIAIHPACSCNISGRNSAIEVHTCDFCFDRLLLL